MVNMFQYFDAIVAANKKTKSLSILL